VRIFVYRAEFRQGCDYLNRFLPAEEKLSDVDHILDLIDFDKSNTIELNEFFEVRDIRMHAPLLPCSTISITPLPDRVCVNYCCRPSVYSTLGMESWME